MLAIKIDDPNIEKSLLSKFETQEEIKEYFHELLMQDLEDSALLTSLQKSHKKDFASKKEVFEVLKKNYIQASIQSLKNI